MSAETNPYSSPQAPGDPSTRRSEASRGVQIVVGVVLVVGCTVLFAVVGGLVAAGLNRFAPGYYPGLCGAVTGPALVDRGSLRSNRV